MKIQKKRAIKLIFICFLLVLNYLLLPLYFNIFLNNFNVTGDITTDVKILLYLLMMLAMTPLFIATIFFPIWIFYWLIGGNIDFIMHPLPWTWNWEELI